MELQHEQTTQINIKNMMTDVHSVIENHFTKMLSELNEKNKDMLTTYNLLQNLPIIKKLEIKLNKANNDIDLLKLGFAEFKDGFNKKDSNMKLNTIELDNGKSVSIIEIEHLVSDAVQKKEISEYKGYAYVGIHDPYEDNSDEEDDILDINSEEKQEWNEYSSLLTNKLHISELKESVVPGVEKVTENEYMATKMVDNTKVVIANSKNVNQLKKLEVDKMIDVEEDIVNEEEEGDEDDEKEDGEEDDEEEDEEDGEEVEEEEVEEEDEEEEEVEEVEEEEVEEEEVEEEDEVNEIEEESDEEEEVEELDIEGVKYYATDSKNGILYEFMEDGDIGDEIGYLKNGAVFFS
jgi:hypothetical protein